MEDSKRLIEVAFPLKQASLDSVHEKNVRHGHISTLHIWPARRPLAACRAALIATLLPDPGNPEERKRLLEKIGGTVVTKIETKKVGGKTIQIEREETVGGILHWGRESNPDLDWFRQKIREAYGGRAPKVLDPFAGGGAIPLEAMRLGCEVTAMDINPVAWFILKCTLEYPQKLAGRHRPLPKFALESTEFMEGFFKGTGKLTKKQLERNLQAVQTNMFPPPDVDLAWHVRAWGWWVLNEARKDLARFYPVYADFEPLQPTDGNWERREPKLVPLNEDGTPDLNALNSEFDAGYLADKRNPRWIAKPTVAYLWARTVKCKNCRAEIPLLKTRWLCKKANKRILLTMEVNEEKTGVRFGIQNDVPVVGGNAAQRREHDKRIGAGTMSRSGAICPCCDAIMTMQDIRLDGQFDRLGSRMTVVVINGHDGKDYRLPTSDEFDIAGKATDELGKLFSNIPFGLPNEATPRGGSGASRAFSIAGYGMDRWHKLFTHRQLLSLGTFVIKTRTASTLMREFGYSADWSEAISAYLASAIDRLVDFSNVNVQWKIDVPTINHALVRFAIQITWDFAEGNPVGTLAGSYGMCLNRVAVGLETVLQLPRNTYAPQVTIGSATSALPNADLVLTDPPYYDAIPYSDLMDWFYIWLRRTTWDLSDEYSYAMNEVLGPKWNLETNEGELIDDSSRHDGNSELSKRAYEDGMASAFQQCAQCLGPKGRLVVVYANKQPDAWETLVSSVIRAGFVAEGSWPIQTEQPSRTRGQGSSALASSIWLVCKKRQESARPGWDNLVLQEMRSRIYEQLREFWDAGIRGPDFVWAATGPALEAYSKHPVVKKANDPGELMLVPEFLRHVRRIVVDFVVGRVLSGNGGADAVSGLDDVTTYYLLHRHDFGMDDAPSGACILYAVSCGLSDKELADQFDILARTGGQTVEEIDEEDSSEEEGESDIEEGTGSKVRLKPWQIRKGRGMGYEAAGGRVPPLIDQAHRLMHLWKSGDQVKVDEYLDSRALRKNALFHQLLQALIELAKESTDERSVLESISNHIAARAPEAAKRQITLPDKGGISIQ